MQVLTLSERRAEAKKAKEALEAEREMKRLERQNKAKFQARQKRPVGISPLFGEINM